MQLLCYDLTADAEICFVCQKYLQLKVHKVSQSLFPLVNLIFSNGIRQQILRHLSLVLH